MQLIRLFLVSALWATLLACSTKSVNTDAPKPINTIPDKMVIFPGCEIYIENRALRNCMSKRVGRHVVRRFNTDIASELGLFGKQKIVVKFKVDEKGDVADINAKAAHPALAAEAVRVIKLLPPIKPAVKDDKPVALPFSLPISFLIE